MTLGFVALQTALLFAMLPQHSRSEIVQLSVEAFWCSHRLLDGEGDAASLLRSKAVMLLGSLCNPTTGRPIDGVSVLRDVISYPMQQLVVSINEPALILDLLESLTRGQPSQSGSWWAKRFASLLHEADALCSVLPSQRRLDALIFFEELDSEHMGILQELVAMQCQRFQHAARNINAASDDDVQNFLLRHIIEDCCDLLSSFVWTRKIEDTVFSLPDVAAPLSSALRYFMSSKFCPSSLNKLVWALDPFQIRLHPELICSLLDLLLDQSHSSRTTVATVYQRCGALLASLERSFDVPLEVAAALGTSLSRIALDEAGLYQFDEKDALQIAKATLSMLSWAAASSKNEGVVLQGLSDTNFDALCDILGASLPPDSANALVELRDKLTFAQDHEMGEPFTDSVALSSDDVLFASYEQIRETLYPHGSNTPSAGRPSTPPSLNIGAVAALMSPPILRSPTITGPTLHKKYSAQDFRHARLSPTSASRPPSTHVDVSDITGFSPLLHY